MPFFWTELNTTDPVRARSFYEATMGWTFRRAEHSLDYWLVVKNEEIIGGLYDMGSADFADVPSHWFSYVEVDDVDRACEIAALSGGEVLREPMTIPEVGRIAILRDPTGSPIGCITPVRGRIALESRDLAA